MRPGTGARMSPRRRWVRASRRCSPTDGRASHARLVTVPVGAVDPISLFAAAVEADLEAALWLRAGRRDRAGRRRPGMGDRARGPGAIRRRRARLARAHRGGARRRREPRADGRARVSRAGDPAATTSGRRSARPRWSCRSWRMRDAGGRRDAHRVGGRRGRPTSRPRSAMGGAGAARPGARAEPERHGREARVRAARDRGEQPSREAWDRLVGMFAGAVGRGRIDKVVLARRVGLRSPVELDVANALRRLAASAPESTTYAFRRGGRTFLGSTPERLARTEGRSFRTMAVAGLDPPGRRCGRGRGPGRGPARLREGSRGAGDRRRLDPRPSWRRSPRRSRSRPSPRS